MILKKGIDVSHWQGTIDWNKVAKSGDVDFSIIRVGGGTKKDPMFKKNIEGALEQGMHTGVYLYSYAKTEAEAKKEAEFVIKNVKSYMINYPIYYDIEDKAQANLSTTECTNLVKAFCDEILSANYIAGMYANTSWFNTKFQLDQLKKYEKWIAHWGISSPSYDGAYSLWQYSNKGKVNGIAGDVDLDYCYVNFNEYGQNYKAGKKIILDKTPVYTSSIRKEPTSYLTGTYYIYDGILYNNRVRITNIKKNVKMTPASKNVTGYVKIQDITL